MRMPTLETPRLIIRPFALSDLAACHQLLDVEPGQGGSLGEREAWLRWTVLNYQQLEKLHQPPYGDRAVVLKDEHRLIGACGLVPCLLPLARSPGSGASAFAGRHVPEVGLYYELSGAERGKGYATEAARALVDWAMRELRLERIIAATTHDNVPSRRVMERLGMRIERHLEPEPHWLQTVGILEAER